MLDRADDRLLVVVGPCSVHDVEAAREYARRLAARAAELRDDLCIAMRVYFEKPRTTTGWKGMITDPHLDGSGDVNTGVRMARGLLLDVLALGVPVGCEWLDPITPQYISDTVAWGAIGARTVESQIHRQLGVGPVDAGRVQEPHRRQRPGGGRRRPRRGRAARLRRRRHERHARRSCTRAATPTATSSCAAAAARPTTAPRTWPSALARLRAAGLPERLVIDASHDNSGKDHERQPRGGGRHRRPGGGRQRARSSGVMLESFLVAGRQDHEAGAPLRYGQSITDACMDWDTTSEVLEQLATAVQGAARDRGDR